MTASQSARDFLATKMKALRQDAGLTIYEVGAKIGKSGKTISAWENGHGQPDAEMMIALYDLYGVESMSEFYGIRDKGLTDDEHELLSLYRKLNQDGKTHIIESAKAFVASGFYISKTGK